MTEVVAFGPEAVLYDDGTLARNAAITITLPGTTTPAVLYADTHGVTVADNPVMTDGSGNLFFFAEVGLYDIVFRGVHVPIEVETGPQGAQGVTGSQGETGPPGDSQFTDAEAAALLDPPDMVILFENALI